MANVDYKAICQELFGTTDVDELKRIAAQMNQKNPRQAGRKRNSHMKMLRVCGSCEQTVCPCRRLLTSTVPPDKS